MCGVDGRINRVQISWEQFQAGQRWDEYPEQAGDPPMTVDMSFTYESREYYLDIVDFKYSILRKDWSTVISDTNFLNLLERAVDEWGGKSFHELIEHFWFVD